MSHQMIYLGHPADAVGLLGVAARKATLTSTRALVASQTGRVHAALGDKRQAETYLSRADELLADGLGDDVPAWVGYFDAAEHAGARAVSARDLAETAPGRQTASVHFEDALKLRKPGFDRVKVMDRIGLAAALFDEGEVERGATAAHQALDDAARIDSTLVASRLPPPASTRCWTRPARTRPPPWTRCVPARRILRPPARPRSPPETITPVGKHSRPGPPNQPSRAVPRIDDGDPLAAYNRRRRAPMDVYRRHRPLHGGGGHLRPDEPRALEEWDGFAYVPAGTADNLAAAQAWSNGSDPGTENS
ncbi:DUF6087 family protein [Streptomyces griseoruber]|uniref:DUF6087 family protein n=1 Tax=Streptomyces griseoruber TaxID=1943 RepID=UPI0037B100FC